MKTAPYRVAIVESQVLFAKALASILASDPEITIVGDFRSPVSAQLTQARPDGIVVDVDGLPEDIGRSLQACTEVATQPYVCVLSMRPSPEMLQRCLTAGAAAYVVKDVAPSDLVRALKDVARGQSYVDPRVAGGLLRRRAGGTKPDIMDLSTRETEVLKLIAEGLANKQISDRLSLSEKTVKNHISRIFSKLHINARTQAAVHAIRVGIA